MLNRIPVCAFLAALALAPAIPAYAADARLSPNDRHFVIEATEDGHTEMELARLAQQNAAVPEVKQLAQRLIDDHMKVSEELDALAGKLGVTLPKEPGARGKGDLKKFEKVTGERFDRDFAEHLVREHERALALFEKQATRGDAEELKAFAARTLPMIQEHLKLLRSLSGRK